MFVSIGARLLFVTFILQVLSVSILVVSSSWKKAGEMMEYENRNLIHHVDRFVTTGSGPEGMSFQHLAPDLRILADTSDPKRVGKRLAQPHPFLERVLKTGVERGSVRFAIPNERFESYGYFVFLPDRSLVLGSIPGHKFQNSFQKSLVELSRIGLFLGGITLLITLFLFRSLLRPLRELTLAMEQAENGSLEVSLPKPGGDETGVLIRVSGVLIERIRMLLAGEARSSRMEEEVNIAAEIQSRLLPPPEVRLGNCEVQSHYQSATETGGDFWGCFESGGKVYLYVGDVTGHGLPSALVTAGVRGSLATLIQPDGISPPSTPTLKQILSTANLAVWDIGGGELQMTLFVSVFDPSTGTLHYTGAGHPPAWIFRKTDAEKSSILHSRGTRLGEAPTLSVIDENSTHMEKGDTLLLYTDGMLTPKGEDLTAEHRTSFRATIAAILAKEESLERSKTAIEFLLFEATGGTPPADDITFALMRVGT